MEIKCMRRFEKSTNNIVLIDIFSMKEIVSKVKRVRWNAEKKFCTQKLMNLHVSYSFVILQLFNILWSQHFMFVTLFVVINV